MCKLYIVSIIEMENVLIIIVYRIINNFFAFNIYIAPLVIKRGKLFKIFEIAKIKLKIFIENKL